MEGIIMEISSEGISLIKKFEGCELKSYRCAANVLTIGYGHTKGVTEDMEITQEEAEKMLEDELVDYLTM
jgi:lysozyme